MDTVTAYQPAVKQTAKPTRRRTLRPDPKGYYRPYIGWTLPGMVYDDEKKGRTQPRFNLGRDPSEAQRRYNRIQELYADCCRTWGHDCWTPFALYAAGLIAKGIYRIPYDWQPWLLEDSDPLAAYAQEIELERRNYPSIEIVPADNQLWVESKSKNREMERSAIASLDSTLKAEGIIGDRPVPDYIVPGSLHQALDLYVKSDIENQNVRPGTSELTQYGIKRGDRVQMLKDHSDDLILMSLGLEEIKEIVSHWRNRPLAKRSKKPMAKNTVADVLGELKRFFSWLDCCDTYRWRKPRGYDSIRWKVTDDQREKVPVHKYTYSPCELATIAVHLDDMGKLALLMGLNCAMGAAELGRLTTDDILLDHPHEFADMLHFSSTDKDWFCRFFRPKSKIFGEWVLWPETIKRLRIAIKRAKRNGTDVLFADDEGVAWYRDAAPNPQYVFANLWSSVTEKLADLPRYPFGSLRDTIPNEFRHTPGVGDEIASVMLAHGKRIGADKLIDCYGNRPFGRLHEAIRKIRDYYQPLLSVL